MGGGAKYSGNKIKRVDLLVSEQDVWRMQHALRGHSTAIINAQLTEQGVMRHGRPNQVSLNVLTRQLERKTSSEK